MASTVSHSCRPLLSILLESNSELLANWMLVLIKDGKSAPLIISKSVRSIKTSLINSLIVDSSIASIIMISFSVSKISVKIDRRSVPTMPDGKTLACIRLIKSWKKPVSSGRPAEANWWDVIKSIITCLRFTSKLWRHPGLLRNCKVKNFSRVVYTLSQFSSFSSLARERWNHCSNRDNHFARPRWLRFSAFSERMALNNSKFGSRKLILYWENKYYKAKDLSTKKYNILWDLTDH